MSVSDHGHDNRPEFLAHHFDNPRQQFEAAKLGMWLFLATEVLMFGGLFGAYAVVRALHPELFLFGSQFLDTTWGAINTVVLILSSLTMALAVWCAQIGHRLGLITFLGLTLFFAIDFLVIKYIEYDHKFHEHLVWGVEFYEDEALLAAQPQQPEGGDSVSDAEREARAEKVWMDTCRTCHNSDGSGVVGQGKDLRGSAFVKDEGDAGLLTFLKKGRMAGDAANEMGIMMPPRGGNPLLSDADLALLIPRLREYAAQPAVAATAVADAGPAPVPLPMSVTPPPSNGPPGLVASWGKVPVDDGPPVPDKMERPPNAHIFFGLYFCMTGLHGIHVLGGIVVLSVLLVLSFKNRFGSSYFTPVELSGLYWHIVDIIWIFLFPLLYLIG